MWRILAVIAAALFLTGVITLFAARFLKNKYTHTYTEDKVLRTVKATNSKNTIFLTSGETYKYIRKYVVCKSGTDKYLICNFARKFKRVGYFIVQYTALKRICSVIRVTETDTTLSSRVIALSKRCAYVNVVISYANSAQINSQVIRPLPRWKIRLFAFFKSLAIFAGLFLLRHAVLEIFGGKYMKAFMNSYWNYALVGAGFLFALLGYFITVLCFRRKNAKESNGGAIEYEFV
ncbi:MAG: hypothetical protein K2L02_00055 [Clostridia bacterium]|nr:hypothetical protein [Clostridia bacterium]